MPSGDAARLGEVMLRDARISSGLSIEDMSAVLRIRRVYLLALEEGRQTCPALPMRWASYATTPRRWGWTRRISSAVSARPSAPWCRRSRIWSSRSRCRNAASSGAIILVGVLLAAAAYGAWYSWSSGGDRTVDAVPPVPPWLETRRARRHLPGTAAAGFQPSVPLPEPVPVPVVVPPPPPPPRRRLRPRMPAASPCASPSRSGPRCAPGQQAPCWSA